MFSMKNNTVAPWRLIPILLLVIGFLAPWAYTHSSNPISHQDVLHGWEVTLSYSVGVFSSGFPISWYLTPIFLIGLGGVALLAYIAVILAMIVMRRRLENNKLTRILLLTGFFIGLYIPLTAISPTDWPPAWGYWVTLAGLLSAICIDVFSKRLNVFIHGEL